VFGKVRRGTLQTRLAYEAQKNSQNRSTMPFGKKNFNH
jgi:hypothetical protein